MRMRIAFWLPRTAESVAAARQILDRIFDTFGVEVDCRHEIALAVSEACSNAVRHATGPDGYVVAAESDDSEMTITVNDHGPGLSQAPPNAMPPSDAVNGRGMALMRITSDGVEMRRRRNGGLSVRLLKNLRWVDGALGGGLP